MATRTLTKKELEEQRKKEEEQAAAHVSTNVISKVQAWFTGLQTKPSINSFSIKTM